MTIAVDREIRAARSRTRVCVAASAAAHALLAVAFLLAPREDAGALALTEITLLEPGESGGAAAAPAAYTPSTRTEPGAAAPSEVEQSFERPRREAEVRPEPVGAAALEDRIAARLATLQTEAVIAPATVPVPSSAGLTRGAPALAGSGAGGTGRSPIALHRGGGVGDGPALHLTRGGGVVAVPAVAATSLPEERSAPARPARGESVARRTLAGATLMGPIADRPVLAHVTPVYPEWAKREGVEGSTTLYFIVGPAGDVRENVLVQKTAGFEDFDESARAALRAWRFAPLSGGATGEQWGTITFNFRLRGTP